jgi:hypothetical protein
MLLTGVHTLGRHNPDLVLCVDLIALCANDFAGARGGEDREFQRPRGNAVLRAQLDHEVRQFSVGEGAVVACLAHL